MCQQSSQLQIDGGDGGGGGAPATECGGGDASDYGGQVPADVRTRSSGNQGPRLPPPAGVQKRSSGNRKRRAAMGSGGDNVAPI